MKLDPETAAQLAALYRCAGLGGLGSSLAEAGLQPGHVTAFAHPMLINCFYMFANRSPNHDRTPQKRDSADALGYSVKPAVPQAAHHHHPTAAYNSSPAGAAVTLVGDCHGFSAAKEAFLRGLISQTAGSSSAAGSRQAQDGKWVARLVGGVKPATAEEVDLAMARLEVALAANGINLQFERCVCVVGGD